MPFSLRHNRNLFTGHANGTATISKSEAQTGNLQIHDSFCYCTVRSLEAENKFKCHEGDISNIEVQGIADEKCPLNGGRGISILSELLSLGKNDDYDPVAILVAKDDKDDSSDAALRSIQSNLNDDGSSPRSSLSATGPPGRIGKLSSNLAVDNVIPTSSEDGSGIDIILPVAEINIGNAGSSIHAPSQGKQYSNTK